jgi:hypothetical protein
MPQSRSRKSPALAVQVQRAGLPAGSGPEQQDSLTNAIRWADGGREGRLDNERSGLDFATGLAERDLSSPVGMDQWSPDLQLHERASTPFVGQWNRLVSQTNWEKGRLILEWRLALEQERAPALEYSDEAWSRLVGGVTSQHVGRLRRVYQRFGPSQTGFAGLYWSHFHAAVEWDDAELWLQGAVEKGWSVAQMRNQRWEAMGRLADQRPDPRDVVHGELDEDLELREANGRENGPGFESSPRREGPDFGDEAEPRTAESVPLGDLPTAPTDPDRVTLTNENAVSGFRPFETVGQLPESLHDLVEDFKLAIIRCKSNHWAEVSQQQILSVLDGLRYLVESDSDLADAAGQLDPH